MNTLATIALIVGVVWLSGITLILFGLLGGSRHYAGGEVHVQPECESMLRQAQADQRRRSA